MKRNIYCFKISCNLQYAVISMLLLFVSKASLAQELKVKSFAPVPTDLTARKQPRQDLNGRQCALLKVMVMDDITDCGKANIGSIGAGGVVKLVYVPSVIKSLTLGFKYHYPLTVVFADYGVQQLEGGATYELRLVDALQMMVESGGTPVSNAQPSHSMDGHSSVVSTQVPDKNKQDSKETVQNMSADEAKALAKEAFRANDYAKAFKLFEYAAERGNVYSQSMVGYLYDKGEGVGQDYLKAKAWYEKAASQGDVYSYMAIGNLYYSGRGVEQNYTKAFEYWYKAASQGNIAAQYNLASLYANGRGVEQNYENAVYWYEKAATGGDKNAYYRLGEIYENGKGNVSSDKAKALNNYYIAAQKGNRDAKILLERMRGGEGNVIGVVTDNANGEPLIGCAVWKEEDHTGAVSDIDGVFRINAKVGDVITFIYVGYETRRVTVEDDKPLFVYMQKLKDN